MSPARLDLTREQILAYRRRVGALDARLPPGTRSLHRAAWAGLQDSMPRAALHSIHARVEGTGPGTWEDPSLVQLWGPRYNTYVVSARDVGVFTVGRMSDDPERRKFAEDTATRLAAVLAGREITDNEAGRALGRHSSSLRYAGPTGTVLIRWAGAGPPTLRTVPPPDIDPRAARLELARRHLHIFGPATPDSFAAWAGITPGSASVAFAALRRSLTPAKTPIGEAWILTRDESELRAPPRAEAPARLLPSGDTYYLLQGADRELLVPDPDRRQALWTSRVWPGAVMVAGAIVGTWRRSQHTVTIQKWGRLSRTATEAVEAEAATLPLPGPKRPVVVRWE